MGQDAAAQRLGQDEHISRSRGTVPKDPVRVYHARDTQPVLRLVVLEGVSPHDLDPGLSRLVDPAPENLAHV